ncbi:hypothetical protein [Gallibacterium sp. AGMB14963]|uniref:VpaChn25_0724 family phage protein n=1 Tax=Gallibacterium faecale TaxID=3019086 RepID=UPI0022F1967B|nr:hypothetical protein [Gallibacterium sp. AGMB14963]MDA3977910.1 hypothetical protein [Gallibacterium sp. AGMB14963]
MDKYNIFAQDQRMLLLHFLAENNNSANDEVLQDCLQLYGHRISRDVVRTQLNWLAEQGLVTVSDFGHLRIAKLTARGFDVSQNQATVEGVKKNPFIDGFR